MINVIECTVLQLFLFVLRLFLFFLHFSSLFCATNGGRWLLASYWFLQRWWYVPSYNFYTPLLSSFGFYHFFPVLCCPLCILSVLQFCVAQNSKLMLSSKNFSRIVTVVTGTFPLNYVTCIILFFSTPVSDVEERN